uniref:Ferritin n=1 Tax=Panagrolaimus davidi TaxID=227884 RepID=A0A914PLE2_9BILA
MEDLMTYQNLRGGELIFQKIQKPPKAKWNSALEAFEFLLDFEKETHDELLKVHKIAVDHNDFHLRDWLETNFLCDMVKHLEELGWIVTNLRRVGTGTGEFVFEEQYFKEPLKIHTMRNSMDTAYAQVQ